MVTAEHLIWSHQHQLVGIDFIKLNAAVKAKCCTTRQELPNITAHHFECLVSKDTLKFIKTVLSLKRKNTTEMVVHRKTSGLNLSYLASNASRNACVS